MKKKHLLGFLCLSLMVMCTCAGFASSPDPGTNKDATAYHSDDEVSLLTIMNFTAEKVIVSSQKESTVTHIRMAVPYAYTYMEALPAKNYAVSITKFKNTLPEKYRRLCGYVEPDLVVRSVPCARSSC